MRKITKKAVEAFVAGKSVDIGNTYVEASETEVRFYLHDNMIARREYGDDRILINDCSWQTSTTRDRLNGLGIYYGFHVYQENYQWYLSIGGEKAVDMVAGATYSIPD